VVAVSGAVCLPGGDWRPSDRIVRRRAGDLHVSPGGVEPAAEDDAGGEGIPAAVLAARAAVGVPEGAVLRVPEPGVRRGAGVGAVADRVVGRVDVPAPSPSDRGGGRSAPGGGMPGLRRSDGTAGVRAGAGTGGLRHELDR